MDLSQHYSQLASYDAWANLEVIASLRNTGAPPERSRKWMAHIISAEYVWLTRLLQETQKFPVWPDLTLDQCEQEADNLRQEWRQYLGRTAVDRLDQTIAYKNSKGEAWSSKVRDVLTHVFMHSAYHRGQIAADMRQSGHQPAMTDFIHGVRQGLVE
jgi:uncharacterized damage-inducible protein DinB